MRRAFTLLEVLIALSILLIGIFGILVLIPHALETGSQVQRDAAASVLLANVDESLALAFSRASPAASPRKVRFFLEDALDTLTLPAAGARLFPRDDDDADDADEWVPSAKSGTPVYPARTEAAAGVSDASDSMALLSFDVAISPAAELGSDASGQPRAYRALARIYRAYKAGEINDPVASGEFLYEYPH